MPVTPIQRLSCALNAKTNGGEPNALVDLAKRWGVPGIAARRAAREIPVNASDYLKLCAAAGIDPVTGAAVVGEPLPDLEWHRVSIKILLALIGGSSLRKLEKKWRVEYTAINRAKHGTPVNISNFLGICRGLGVHPHAFLARRPMFHVEQALPQSERLGA